MKTLIFKALAPYLTALMIVFAFFVFIRGHNDPGGGFIGGLIMVSALAIHGLAYDVSATKRALLIPPLNIAAFGVLCALFSGLPSVFMNVPFLTGFWAKMHFPGFNMTLATPFLFDLGVFLVVTGAVGMIGLSLESEREKTPS